MSGGGETKSLGEVHSLRETARGSPSSSPPSSTWHKAEQRLYLSRLPGGPCPSLGDLLSQGRDVSSLLIQNHVELSVQLLDLKVDAVLAFEDLSQLTVSH